MTRDADVVVVGAGVVGLACAASLARRGRRVIVSERRGAIATETTSRNSEVVHAGLYYPPGSLKAQLCVAGRELLLARCASRRLPHRVTGKLVVACDEAERERLEALRSRGEENGAAGLRVIEADEVARMEPALRADAALHSPGTGIVDALALCRDLLAEAEGDGTILALRTEVRELAATASGWRVTVADADGAPASLACGAVVNAAGLASDAVAELAGVDIEACAWRQHLCKGDYFALAASARMGLSRLVYPVPGVAGLGIHATLDLAGAVRFGPDANYVDRPSLEVDAAKAGAFAEAIRRYLPAIEPAALTPAYAGLRPKLAAPGEAFRDFVVEESSAVGAPAMVHCIGIESPGLTAALAIGERVAALLAGI